MRLNLNFAQTGRRKQPGIYLAYSPLLLLLIITLAGNYYWYSSIKADIARYNERLSKIEVRALGAKDTHEESVSQKEKEYLSKETVFINTIIKSKFLSWSGLLARLEKEHIPNISMVSLSPKVVEDKVRIDIRGVGKDLDTITLERKGTPIKRPLSRAKNIPKREKVFFPCLLISRMSYQPSLPLPQFL